jgi:phosphopantothenate---cysteine ligase (CTP)
MSQPKPEGRNPKAERRSRSEGRSPNGFARRSRSQRVHCVITAGPTFEPLDAVRRLTNSSTGRLGAELADFLAERGHQVTLLLSAQATWRSKRCTHTFTTTSSLRDRLRALAGTSVDAVFHAAAVSDFAFGKVWTRSAEGQLVEIQSGKLTTRQGTLLAELVPTPKIIAELRDWFPRAWLVGWKYEVEGDLSSVIELAQKQISDCRTDACVANGPAYGSGFRLIQANEACTHVPDAPALFELLVSLLSRSPHSLRP